MSASALGVSSAPNAPCSARPATRNSMLGATAHSTETSPKPRDAEREHAPLAEDVAERAADQDQRAERQQVGVRDPLLAGEAAAEVVADRGQRDVDRRRVEARDERSHDRREQRQLLASGAASAPRVRCHRACMPSSALSGSAGANDAPAASRTLPRERRTRLPVVLISTRGGAVPSRCERL